MTIEPVRPLIRPATRAQGQQDSFDFGSGENRDAGTHPSGYRQNHRRYVLALGLEGSFFAKKLDHF